MYFTRYIWIYIEKVYLKRKKKRRFIERIRKIPLTRIPDLFYSCRRKRYRKYKKYNLRVYNQIFFYKINLINIFLYLNKYSKYKFIFTFNYNIDYNINYLYKNYRKKSRFLKIRKFLNIHNGKYYSNIKITRLKELKLTLSTLVETVTYGFKKQKKKQIKPKSKPKAKSKTKTTKKSKKKNTGQRGKFLLNKVPLYMFWKYHIINKFENNKIYFRCKIIYQIIIFLFKKDIYLLYFFFFKKKYKLEELSNNFNEVEIYLKKSVRNYMRKIFYSQLKITKYNNWLILYIDLFSTDLKKDILKNKAYESYFRFRHIYNYLSPNIQKIKMVNKLIREFFIFIVFGIYWIFMLSLYIEYFFETPNFISNKIPVNLLNDIMIIYLKIENFISNFFIKLYFLGVKTKMYYWDTLEIPVYTLNIEKFLHSGPQEMYSQFYFIIVNILYLLFLTIWTRAAGPRVRLDQITQFTFKKSTPIIMFIILVIIIHSISK